MDPATNTTAATTSPATPPAGPAATSAPSTTPSGAGDGAAAPPVARVFTQEEVNRIAAGAREEGRQSATKKATDGQDPKAGGGQQPAATGAQVPDVTSVVQQAVAQALQAAGVDPFTVAARQAGYSDAQIHLARAAHDAAKPPDLGKWLGEWPTQVGMQIKAQGNGPGAPTPTASNGAAPRKVEDLRDDNGLVDVFSLSPEQVLAMGPTRIREEFEKVAARGRELSGAPPIPAALRRK